MSATASLPAAVPLQRVRLALDGFELEAERWNGGERAHVLLLHGLGGNSVTWHGVAPVLAGSLEADVLALDMPGFGRSRTGGRSVGVRVLSGLVEATVRSRAASGTRWILAGNSLGAVLALDLACRAPELVLAASVIAPALPLLWGRGVNGLLALRSWVPAALPWLGGRLVAKYMRQTGLPGVVDQPIRALFGDERRLDPGLRERLLEVSGYRLGWVEEAGRAYEQVTWSLGMELLAPSGAARAIRQVRCPVLAVRGERDPIFAQGAWEKLERKRPDWTYETLPDIGHVPQLEAPEAVARCLSKWLRQLVPQ